MAGRSAATAGPQKANAVPASNIRFMLSPIPEPEKSETPHYSIRFEPDCRHSATVGEKIGSALALDDDNARAFVPHAGKPSVPQPVTRRLIRRRAAGWPRSGEAACENVAARTLPARTKRPHDTAGGVLDPGAYRIHLMLIHDFHLPP
jgi:hypothetical protein